MGQGLILYAVGVSPDFWPRLLFVLLFYVPFSLWMKTRDFQAWERFVLGAAAIIGLIEVFEALRATLF
ncbi:hypothetical protein GCM10008955_00970 [Deinococcus malanensis]|uniref:Uncharacterized protein n=1 Tax=Deinococcus malanensis TaxID=1706855 RepID=A0ABQ2EJ84_9DEIO|nr:hypothetical protein GCM10008955_00970 [Deinococcus malanensis]